MVRGEPMAALVMVATVETPALVAMGATAVWVIP